MKIRKKIPNKWDELLYDDSVLLLDMEHLSSISFDEEDEVLIVPTCGSVIMRLPAIYKFPGHEFLF